MKRIKAFGKESRRTDGGNKRSGNAEKRSGAGKLLSLFFPPRCPVCDDAVSLKKGLICPACYKKLKPISHPFCYRCGRPLPAKEKEYCRDCLETSHFFAAGRALYVYEDVAGSIYRFKYGKRQEYAAFFGKEMAEKLAGFIAETKADALVPVPLSKQRIYSRGYNQAQLLAKEISKHTGVPLYSDLVVRIKDTVPQKELNPAERQNNLKKAFKIARNDVKLSTIIVIDDIYTTGSTADAIARLLRKAGIQKIYVLALTVTAGR